MLAKSQLQSRVGLLGGLFIGESSPRMQEEPACTTGGGAFETETK